MTVSGYGCFGRWSVGIGVTGDLPADPLWICVPLVFSGAENNLIHRSVEETRLAAGICKDWFYGVVVIFILVHKHDGPLLIGTLDSVGSY